MTEQKKKQIKVSEKIQKFMLKRQLAKGVKALKKFRKKEFTPEEEEKTRKHTAKQMVELAKVFEIYDEEGTPIQNSDFEGMTLAEMVEIYEEMLDECERQL